ncbi:MAG: hypothetical protein ACRC31_06215 [Cetobacterium sp.]
MNLEKIANSQITAINPNKKVTVYKWIGQQNVDGTNIPEYEEPIIINMQVQPTSDSRLERIEGVNKEKIHKTFWIPNNEISGLNYFENKDRDMLVLDGFIYRIVHEYDQFETGWRVVVGAKGERYVID